MSLYWCSYCYTVYPKGEECDFCRCPLVDLPQEISQGNWHTFCSQGQRTSPAQPELVLGREDRFTAFLFTRHPFVSRQHLKITASQGSILLHDLGSPNGTYVETASKQEEQESQTPWRCLTPDEEIFLPSGSQILLSKECPCYLWLQWVPSKISSPLSQKPLYPIAWFPTATQNIDNRVRIFWDRGKHWLEDLHPSSQPKVSINRRHAVLTALQRGDRLAIQNKEYVYTPGKLLPASPLPEITISLENVKVNSRLDIASLCFSSSHFMGIVGASGAGKSTLLKILTGWLTPCQGSVALQVGEHNTTVKESQQQIAYLPQYDIVYDNLTVENTLVYSALLRGHHSPWQELQEKIEHILSQVGLLAEREKRIRNLSGGQRRRVNIASELLREGTSLLILDEPTSGLDLANDARIMELLQKLCRQGHTVICTTHHLGNMELFDEIVVLEKGRVKDTGSPAELAGKERVALGESNWTELYAEEEQEPTQRERQWRPLALLFRRMPSWVLMVRRCEEFRHPPGLWSNLLATVVVIPLLIGLGIYTAYPIFNGDEKRFFLCAVAAFWLGMSLSSQELRSQRYRIFLHERGVGVPAHAFLLCYLIFYSFISFVQIAILVLPSTLVLEKPLGLWIFPLLAWAMGTCGAIWGLNLVVCESRWKIPTAVTVPCFTVMQLLFSEMVMGRLLMSGHSYFSFSWQKPQDILYTLTFSRYPDMAYRAYHNSMQQIPDEFWWNTWFFIGAGLVVPTLVLWGLLQRAQTGEEM